MSKSHAKRFVQSAWTLLSFQFIASVAAVAVTGLAAVHVQQLAAQLEASAPEAAVETANGGGASLDPAIATDPTAADPAAAERDIAEDAPAEAVLTVAPCQVGRQQNLIRVMANVEWCDTGIQVQRGQRLVFTVRGNWSHSGEPVLDPGGSDVSEPRAVYRRASHGALIGRAGETIFLIGAGGEIQAPADGALQFSINDIPGQFRDNPGYVDIFLQLAQQPQAAPAN